MTQILKMCDINMIPSVIIVLSSHFKTILTIYKLKRFIITKKMCIFKKLYYLIHICM